MKPLRPMSLTSPITAIQHAYTVDELDQLRYYHRNHYLYGFYDGKAGYSRSFKSSELDAYVEQRVRTDMLAGLRPADYAAKIALDSPGGPVSVSTS